MLIHLVWTARTEYWAWACHNDEVCFVESDAFVTYLRGTQELAETVVMYFCLLDILIQLRSTYHDPSGRECVDPMTCARRYVTAGSFVFDLLCALPFEAFAPLESGVAHSTEVACRVVEPALDAFRPDLVPLPATARVENEVADEQIPLAAQLVGVAALQKGAWPTFKPTPPIESVTAAPTSA